MKTSPRTTKNALVNISTPQPEEGDDVLYHRLQGTTEAQLKKGVESLDGLTTEQEDGHKRKIRIDNSKTLNQLRRWFYKFLFMLLCGVVTILSVGFLYLLYLWVSSFINDSEKIGSFLGQAAWSMLLVLATLFCQNIFSDKDP